MSNHIITHQQLLDYWLEKRGDRIAPTRADIEPLDFPMLWPEIVMYKVLHAPLNYEVTFLGTRMVEIWERDYTGWRLDDMLLGPIKDKIRSQFDHAVEHCKYSLESLDSSWMGKDFVKYTRLLLPLSDDGVNVNRLLLCIFFEEKS